MAITIDDALDALIENADFEEQASLAKAKKFVSAAKRYLVLAPLSSTDQGTSMTINAAQIQAMLVRAQEYTREQQSTTAANTRVRFLSANEGFRR